MEKNLMVDRSNKASGSEKCKSELSAFIVGAVNAPEDNHSMKLDKQKANHLSKSFKELRGLDDTRILI